MKTKRMTSKVQIFQALLLLEALLLLVFFPIFQALLLFEALLLLGSQEYFDCKTNFEIVELPLIKSIYPL